ncbi:hypothetical protein [Mycobacterium sp. 1465703.0]|uniref:hypothetical protein n=1 Tax=Mycobacterium sp. 1465703.0 TaxID=1834078 RepID=UPI0007FF74F1|nr:hypothetical protein [Mycobacterium sp. 1465703.0]OBI95568.1 hypothetical protein A5625_08110 [Mycobacterium sp. 1465703.0]
MTAPNLGPCRCEVVDQNVPFSALPAHAKVNTALGLVLVDHEHSDFEPYPCAEPNCPCGEHRPVYRPPGDETEPGENRAQTAAAPRNRYSVSIPADALEFAGENVAQTAAWIDGVLAWLGWTGGEARPLDDARTVCDFADALDAAKPEHIDTMTALALALRRLAAANRDNSARRFVAGIRRKLAGR